MQFNSELHNYFLDSKEVLRITNHGFQLWPWKT